jgi:hypothetical protein
MTMGVEVLLSFLAPWMIPSAVGGVFIVRYAMKDVMVKEENLNPEESPFPSEYDELMWLAEKEKGHISDDERKRFFQLRNRWPEMHSAFNPVPF